MRRSRTFHLSITAVIACLTVGTVAPAPVAPAASTSVPVVVSRVDGMSTGFLSGVDVSSVLSLEESGVVFRERSGSPADLFAVLADAGVTAVRVRVWNDPFDDRGRGYGGGNVDVGRAVEVGRRATAAGLGVLVDFHYSDFWADPGRQLAPKSWAGSTPEATAAAVRGFTVSALRRFEDAGVDVRVVQVGNETNTGMAGYSRDATSMDASLAALFAAGASAVREVLPHALSLCTSRTRNPSGGTRRSPRGSTASESTTTSSRAPTIRTGTARPRTSPRCWPRSHGPTARR